MNQLTLNTTDGVQTMSSLAMVEYINATREPGSAELLHRNFMAKVQKVLPGTYSKFLAHVPTAIGNGAIRNVQVYNFPKREAMLMAMSYSYELQAVVFDAWQAAEAKVSVPVLPSFPEALRMLADSVERETKQALQIANQTVQIEAAAPAVAFVEKYVECTDGRLFRQVAKLLGAPERDFRNFLVDHKFMKQMNKSWVVLAPHLTAGRFEQRERIVNDVLRYTVYFTPKGIAYISKKWNERKPVLRKTLSAPRSVAGYA